MISASFGEIPKKSGSNLSKSGTNPPHLEWVFAGSSAGSPNHSRQSKRSGGISRMRSWPASRCDQRISFVADSGKRPLAPTIATDSPRRMARDGVGEAAGLDFRGSGRADSREPFAARCRAIAAIVGWAKKMAGLISAAKCCDRLRANSVRLNESQPRLTRCSSTSRDSAGMCRTSPTRRVTSNCTCSAESAIAG